MLGPRLVSLVQAAQRPASEAASTIAVVGAGLFALAATLPVQWVYVSGSALALACGTVMLALMTQVYHENYPEHQRVTSRPVSCAESASPRRACMVGMSRNFIHCMICPKPSNESMRLKVLWQYEVLDTVPEEMFDDLTELAASICEAPIAMVSLVDEDRQWFKSARGINRRQTSRNISFCAHAICQPGLLVVPDARLDPRFKDNPLVTKPPKIRFYAGAPLVTPDGYALGTLCVLDKKPRKLTPLQRRALEVLSRVVLTQLELRRQVRVPVVVGKPDHKPKSTSRSRTHRIKMTGNDRRRRSRRR